MHCQQENLLYFGSNLYRIYFSKKEDIPILLKCFLGALTSVAQWVGHRLAKRKIARWIPGQGHLPGLLARSPAGMYRRHLIDVSLPLFLLPFPLSKNN